MTDPTPSAPTAEMLAQEIRRLADVYANYKAGRTAMEMDRLPIARDTFHAAIDRLAALARSEPKCDPTLTECPRCKNDMQKCDGLFARSEPPTGEPVAISDERIGEIYREHYPESWMADGSLRKFARALLAEARAPGAVPEGMWLAPVEPDVLMFDAAKYAEHPQTAWDDMRDSWLERHPPIEAQAAHEKPLAWGSYTRDYEAQAGEPKP